MAIEVRPIKTLADRLRTAIAKLLPGAAPVVFNRCAPEAELKLVARTFVFKSGAKKTVKLQAQAMAAFEHALKLCPSLEVTASAESIYSGSFRSHAVQRQLYEAYKAGTGHLAAAPCSSWHEAGLAVDVLSPDVKDPDTKRTPREALVASGFHTYVPNDPPHHSYRVDTATDKTFPKPKWITAT